MSQDKKSFNNRSSGQRGPSRKVATAALPPGFIVVKGRSVKKRSSRRGRRARGGRPPGKKRSELMFSTGKSTLTMPASVASSDAGHQYLRHGGSVKHKEWGIGSRMIGRSVLGFVSYGATSTRCFFPQVSTLINSGLRDVNEYTVSANCVGQVFPLIPGVITRLTQEGLNWGRYAWRAMTLEYDAVSTTNTTNGYAFGASRDVTLPFSTDWANGSNLPTVSLSSIERSATAAAYQGFLLKFDDYTGDKTWPTQLPSVSTAGVVTNLIPFADEVAIYYPYFYAMRSTSATNTATSFSGWIYVNYTIDFYNPIHALSSIISATANTVASTLDTLASTRVSQQSNPGTLSSSVSATTSSVGSLSLQDRKLHPDGTICPSGRRSTVASYEVDPSYIPPRSFSKERKRGLQFEDEPETIPEVLKKT